MAATHGKVTDVYIAGFDMSGFLNSFDMSASRDVAEKSTFADTAKTYAGGMLDATLSLEGNYDGDSNAVVDQFNAVLGAANDVLFTIFPQADARGNDGWGFAAKATSFNVNTNLGSVAACSVDAQSSVGAELLVSLHALGAETSAGNIASVDGAASSSAGGVSYLHVTALTGTNIIVKVQHSSDDSTFVDLITHTSVTAANGKERKTTAALTTTVNRYTRTNTSGTFSSATFVHAFGRSPNVLAA